MIQDPNVLLKEAIALAKAGKTRRAQLVLQSVVARAPKNITAWLYLAGTATDEKTATEALRQVERLNPEHPQLTKAKQWAAQKWQNKPASFSAPASNRPPAPPPPTPKQAARRSPWRWALLGAIISILMVTVIVILWRGISSDVLAAFTPEPVATATASPAEQWTDMQTRLNTAKIENDRNAIIQTLIEMHDFAPDNSDIAAELAQIYFDKGMVLRNGGNFADAEAAFTQAYTVFPAMDAAQTEAELARRYRLGAKLYQDAAWEDAATEFEAIYAENPAYPYVDEILYSTYFNLGLMKSHQNEPEAALAAYQRAAKILPSATEAAAKADEVYLALHPPTPTPTPTPLPTATPRPIPPTAAAVPPIATHSSNKEIVVDISEQRTYLYENGTLVNQFIVSTGEPGRDTAPGHYQILDKIPVAYASTWDLDMPYWMGIYWAGPLENGFHALPTVRHTGYTLWDGYLGQRVSYGCIILSMQDAETLYNWADVGTDVTIRY